MLWPAAHGVCLLLFQARVNRPRSVDINCDSYLIDIRTGVSLRVDSRLDLSADVRHLLTFVKRNEDAQPNLWPAGMDGRIGEEGIGQNTSRNVGARGMSYRAESLVFGSMY